MNDLSKLPKLIVDGRIYYYGSDGAYYRAKNTIASAQYSLWITALANVIIESNGKVSKNRYDDDEPLMESIPTVSEKYLLYLLKLYIIYGKEIPIWDLVAVLGNKFMEDFTKESLSIGDTQDHEKFGYLVMHQMHVTVTEKFIDWVNNYDI